MKVARVVGSVDRLARQCWKPGSMFPMQSCHNLTQASACIATNNMVGDWYCGRQVMGKSSMAGRYPVFLGSGCMNMKFMEKVLAKEGKMEQQEKHPGKPKVKTHWNEEGSPKCIIEFGEWVDQLLEEIGGQAGSGKKEEPWMANAAESPTWKWKQVVGGTAVKVSGKLCGLFGHWKKKIARKIKAVKGRINTAKHQIRLGQLKDVVRDQESQPGSGNWWANRKDKWHSQMDFVGNQVVLRLLTLSAVLLGVEPDLHEAAKKKLHTKQQHVGRSRQLLESMGAAELDRLSSAMTEWHRGCQLEGKKLLTRSKLRCARRVVRQYEKMASLLLKCSHSQEKQSLVVNGERTECCKFVGWYEQYHGSAEEERSENLRCSVIACVGTKIWCLAKGSLLLVSQMAAGVADCCRWAMMGIRRVSLAGTRDNLDCHNEVFVQIGFECLVVPVNNDLNDSVEDLHWQQ